MSHETLRLDPGTAVEPSELWMYQHGVDWGPASLDDHLHRFGIYESDSPASWSLHPREKLQYLGRQPLFVAEVGDTLCWDGIRVWLHASSRQEVDTCEAREARMLKFGTGMITVPDDQGEAPIVRTATALTEEDRLAIVTEGETSSEE